MRRIPEIGPVNKQVGRRVRKLRREREISLKELGEMLGQLGYPKDHTQVSRIESGQTRITVDELMAFSVALQTTPNFLLFGNQFDKRSNVEQ